jgi:sialic acid synthase SpsE
MTAKVIAEIGCNHKGSMDIAKEMISAISVGCSQNQYHSK